MDHSVHSYGILFIATPSAKLQISCDKLVVSCGGNWSTQQKPRLISKKWDKLFGIANAMGDSTCTVNEFHWPSH